MTTPLTIEVRSRDGSPVVAARGEIDLSNVESFSKALQSIDDHDDAEPILVDLSAIEYLDSSGINALFAHADRIRVLANAILLPVLEVSGLTEVVTVEPA
jgi:anti-anti-sigma factor